MMLIYIFYRILGKYPEKTLFAQDRDHSRADGDAGTVTELRHCGAIVDLDALFAPERLDRLENGRVCVAGKI